MADDQPTSTSIFSHWKSFRPNLSYLGAWLNLARLGLNAVIFPSFSPHFDEKV
jgi:hypothetical protein